ncbi:MAG: hypothetical protein KDB17_15170 [Ilumatobacter sp.]|nr:hypothetical protein [Ilumatobacter sp.]
MAHVSDPFFRTFHALRLKGFAKAEIVAEVADLPVATVEDHLAGLQARELATFREARQLWQLTPGGREAHGLALAEDLAGADVAALSAPYQQFLALNERFKALCADWQLRGGEPNDHSDDAYDAGVVARLRDIDAAAQPVVADMGGVLARLGAYAPRLERTCQRVADGETNMFTGVMCGSYHDVWMELHEDLILTQGIDRAAEGSF